MQGVVAKNDASCALSRARTSVTGQTTIAASTATTSLPNGRIVTRGGPAPTQWRSVKSCPTSPSNPSAAVGTPSFWLPSRSRHCPPRQIRQKSVPTRPSAGRATISWISRTSRQTRATEGAIQQPRTAHRVRPSVCGGAGTTCRLDACSGDLAAALQLMRSVRRTGVAPLLPSSLSHGHGRRSGCLHPRAGYSGTPCAPRGRAC